MLINKSTSVAVASIADAEAEEKQEGEEEIELEIAQVRECDKSGRVILHGESVGDG